MFILLYHQFECADRCIITDTAQQRSMLCGITTDSTFLYRVDASRTDAQGTQTGFSETELTALRQELML